MNVGDSYSVHHVPEEWTDGVFSEERGARGSRFAAFLHSHPNAYAHPSQADAEAADWTEGVEMILGVRFSPRPGTGVVRPGGRSQEGPETGEGRELPVLARVAGRKVHGFELIGYLRNGEGVNLLITSQKGFPIGWTFDWTLLDVEVVVDVEPQLSSSPGVCEGRVIAPLVEARTIRGDSPEQLLEGADIDDPECAVV